MATSALPETVARWRFQPIPGVFTGLVVIAASYNGIFAVVNAHIFPVTYGIVALTELALLGAAFALALATGLTQRDLAPLSLLFGFLTIALLMSIGNNYPYLEMVRNIAIITTFTMAGMRVHQRELIRAAAMLSIVVLLVLILEIASQSAYVAIFQPAAYLESSRGITQAEFNETGLFANALGFEGRFSFGLFNTARTSSIFIEQVSLASFAAVITVFLLAFWSRLPRWQRILHVAVVLLIVTSNNSRSSSALLLSALAGYFIYPRLPRYLNFALVPGLLIFSAVVVAATGQEPADNLPGRLAVTVAGLGGMDLSTLFLGSLGLAYRSFDSGYVFIIAASTLFGMIFYWLYVCLVVPQRTIDQRRGMWGLNIYLFTWLLIGGTATFSIKSAALLWLLVGYLRVCDDPATTPGDAITGKPAWRA